METKIEFICSLTPHELDLVNRDIGRLCLLKPPEGIVRRKVSVYRGTMITYTFAGYRADNSMPEWSSHEYCKVPEPIDERIPPSVEVPGNGRSGL